jgi:hypothetical protein
MGWDVSFICILEFSAKLGVIAGNRNRVNRKLLRTFLFVSTWPPFVSTWPLFVSIWPLFVSTWPLFIGHVRWHADFQSVSFKAPGYFGRLSVGASVFEFSELIATRRRSTVAVGRREVSPKPL